MTRAIAPWAFVLVVFSLTSPATAQVALSSFSQYQKCLQANGSTLDELVPSIEEAARLALSTVCDAEANSDASTLARVPNEALRGIAVSERTRVYIEILETETKKFLFDLRRKRFKK